MVITGSSMCPDHLPLAVYLAAVFIFETFYIPDSKTFPLRKTLYRIPKLSVCHDGESSVSKGDQSSKCDWPRLSQPLTCPPIMYDN